MSLVIGILTFPFVFIVQAYVQVCSKMPREEAALSNRDIKDAMQPFLDKCNIRKDLIFLERFNLQFCQAIGTNGFKTSDAAIVIAPGFYQVDKEACFWVICTSLDLI